MVTLSEEYFPQFFVGDTVNLAALSPFSEIQAAAALEGDQLVSEEVSHLKKLGPLLQEKIQFFLKWDGATRVL